MNQTSTPTSVAKTVHIDLDMIASAPTLRFTQGTPAVMGMPQPYFTQSYRFQTIVENVDRTMDSKTSRGQNPSLDPLHPMYTLDHLHWN